jgi:hypothetical protein
MVLYAIVGPVYFTQIGVGLLYVIGMQAPSETVSVGSPCLVRSLTATGKVTFMALLQLSVGLAMVIIYAAVELWQSLPPFRARTARTAPITTLSTLDGVPVVDGGEGDQARAYTALPSPLGSGSVAGMASPTDVVVPGMVHGEGVAVARMGEMPAVTVLLPSGEQPHGRASAASAVASASAAAAAGSLDPNGHSALSPPLPVLHSAVAPALAGCGVVGEVEEGTHTAQGTLPVLDAQAVLGAQGVLNAQAVLSAHAALSTQAVLDALPVLSAQAVTLVGAAAQGAPAVQDTAAVGPPALAGPSGIESDGPGVAPAARRGTLMERRGLSMALSNPLPDAESGDDQPLVVQGAVGQGQGQDQAGQAVAQVRRARDSVGTVPILSHRAMLVTAAANFGLTAYATLTLAAVKLLHCVWVPGTPSNQRRLYIRGSTVCSYSGWQAGFIVLVAILIAAPVAVVWLATWSRRMVPPSASSLKKDLRLGLKRALVDGYRDSAYW